MSSFISSLGRDVSIDIGTTNTRATVGGRDIVVVEPFERDVVTLTIELTGLVRKLLSCEEVYGTLEVFP